MADAAVRTTPQSLEGTRCKGQIQQDTVSIRGFGINAKAFPVQERFAPGSLTAFGFQNGGKIDHGLRGPEAL